MPAATPTVTYVDNADGTVTATIAGSTAGSTNKVLGARWAASILAVSFAQLASRVGDGSVEFAVDPLGLWFSVVRSEVSATDVALSAISSFRASDGLDAIHMRCCDSVKETIQALSLVGVEDDATLDPANVKVMKLPWRAGLEIDQLGIIISPIREGLESDDNNRDELDYRVQVAFVEAADGKLTLGLGRALLRRELVTRAFSELILPGVTENSIVYVDPGPIIIPEGVEANYDVGGIILHCMCKVNRAVL